MMMKTVLEHDALLSVYPGNGSPGQTQNIA